uniref:Uncharacterized protein n=1 Tax=Heterorhabditis bacteriophora TaxID=37862 RepID=A0A1I7WX03_HETBA
MLNGIYVSFLYLFLKVFFLLRM